MSTDSNGGSKPRTRKHPYEDVRIEQEASLDADVRVVKDALENPHLWSGSDLALRALRRIRNRLELEGALPRDEA